MRMNKLVFAAAALAVVAAPALAGGKKENKGVASTAGVIVFYDGPKYSGRSVEIDSRRTAVDVGFNIKSIGVHEGEKWRICAKPRLAGECLLLTESVPDAGALGIYGGIGSLEPVKN
jgi:hypothetical protein